MIAVSFRSELGVLQNDLLIPLEFVRIEATSASSLRKASRSLSFRVPERRELCPDFLCGGFAASGIVSLFLLDDAQTMRFVSLEPLAGAVPRTVLAIDEHRSEVQAVRLKQKRHPRSS